MKYPNIPQLKLNYNITKATDMDAKTIIASVVSILEEKEYKILEETHDSVEFFDNPWKLRWNFQRAIPLDGGSVEVLFVNNDKSISFNYYLDFFPLLLLVSLLIVSVAVDHEYEAIVFFVGFYFISGVISIIRAKIEAKNILKGILYQRAVN